jgi:hypothetical protein
MTELEELRIAYAECSRQRNELLNKLKTQPQQESVANLIIQDGRVAFAAKILPDGVYDLYTSPPAQQEPVAYLSAYELDQFAKVSDFMTATLRKTSGNGRLALYTSPQPAQRTWVGLTHEEHMKIMTGTMTASSRMVAVEAKLKEKNT